MGSENLKVIQYLVDTRKLWPGATKTAQLENEVSELAFFLPSFLIFITRLPLYTYLSI